MKCSFGEVVKCPPFSLPSPQPPLCTCTQTHHGSHLYVCWIWATFSYNTIIFSNILKYERLFKFIYFKIVVHSQHQGSNRVQFSSVLFSHSVVSDSLWPYKLQHARQASLSITNSRSLPKLMSIELVMPSNHLILWCPLLLLPSIFPSIRVFSSESALCIKWPKYWSFCFNISPSNEHPRY